MKANWGTLKDLIDVDFVAGWVIKVYFTYVGSESDPCLQAVKTSLPDFPPL